VRDPTQPEDPHLSKLAVLLFTAFVDMVGVLMLAPLLPLYARDLGASGFMVGALLSSFSAAQLLSAPLWGRFSDRYGRRPALLVGLTASAIAYLIFAFADSLWLLVLSRLVQGAGGGTVGVLQAYVADATEPKDRAKSLGWLSAATNLGVTIGPVLGSVAYTAGGRSAPGLIASALCMANILFASRFLPESRQTTHHAGRPQPIRARDGLMRVFRRPGEAAPRLIWIYAIGMGAFTGYTAVLALFLADGFGVSKTNVGLIFSWYGLLSVVPRAFLLGPAVDRFGEARVSRFGQVLLSLGLLLLPLTATIPAGMPLIGPFEVRHLALLGAVALVPLGTAFTFPCVTALLSHVIRPEERGVMMGVQQSFGGGMRVLGPLWAGFAFDHLGRQYPFWSSSVVIFGTLLLGIGIETRARTATAAADEPAVAPG
jgi:multidrug resistance protein